jgi:2-methylcitrate dehydratase PrpD
MASLSQIVSEWASRTQFSDLPSEVVATTRLRVLDVIGLALAGLGTPFGAAVRRAAVAMHPGNSSRILGTGERSSAAGAALANGALSQALEYDDTHNRSIVHMSSPSVAAALALAEIRQVSGLELIAAIAVGSEISCRLGSVAPGQFHQRGFHPTGLFAPFGAAWLAGRLLGLTAAQMVNAAGIVGSFASGLLECWVDGTQSKFLHAGWAAQSGIAASLLARAGTTGPKTVIEGRFGLLASHLQNAQVQLNFAAISADLGQRWESQNASFKPFPVAHVIHPYIDAVLRLRAQYGLVAENIDQMVCPVAAYIVPIVCEPTAEKRRPSTDAQARVSFQFVLAQAMVDGAIGSQAFATAALCDRRKLGLAERVIYEVDQSFPGPERFKGVVHITTREGQQLTATEEYNRGSPQHPMTVAEIVAKFTENAAPVLAPQQIERVVEVALTLERCADSRRLIDLAVAGESR